MGAKGDRLLALVSLHASTAGHSPADRDALLVAYANYRQSLEHLRGESIDLDNN